jgi:hypothetical protein
MALKTSELAVLFTNYFYFSFNNNQLNWLMLKTPPAGNAEADKLLYRG